MATEGGKAEKAVTEVGEGAELKGVAGVAKGGYLAPSSTLASSHLGPGGEAGQCLLLL